MENQTEIKKEFVPGPAVYFISSGVIYTILHAVTGLPMEIIVAGCFACVIVGNALRGGK